MADNSGRGYLPPTVPNPSAPHRRQWSVGPPTAPPATFYAPSQPWQVGHSQIHGAKPYLVMPPGHGSSSPQSESMDLSSSRPGQAEPAHNGDPINGQMKEAAAGVSVIAPNPLVAAEEVKLGEASDVGSKLFERSPMDFVVPENKMPSFPPASAPLSTTPDLKGLPVHPLTTKPLDQAGIPTPFEAKGPPAESEGNPSHPVESKVTLRPMDVRPLEPLFAPGVPAVRPAEHRFPNPGLPQDEPGLPPAPGSLVVEPLPAPPAPAPSLPPPPPVASQASSALPRIATIQAPPEPAPSSKPPPVPEPDHVESLLENMFQVGDESPAKQSVIVSNTAKTPALTEDKVVAILEDKSPVESLEVKTEVKAEPEGNKFMEVESELEKMFAGIVEPVEDTKPPVSASQPPKSENSSATPEQPKRRKRTPGKPRPRKSVDSDAPIEPRKRGRKPGSGKAVKKPRHDKFKDASNDSSNMSGIVPKRGPYLYIEGPKDMPSKVCIVNSGSRDEEERDRGMVKGVSRRKHHRVEGRLKGAGLYSSTLSAKYNAQNADLTWVCTFCKLRSNCEKGLGGSGEPAGDLFGPYILTIPKEPEHDPRDPKDSDVVAEQKRRGGGKQASLRAVGGAEQFIKDVVKKNKKSAVVGEDLSGEREIWVHEKCAVWAPGVFLVGHHLVGLAEAVAAASVTKCSYCSHFGASLGCVVRNCPVRCHYGCAVATRWDLNYDTFIAKCPNHTKHQKT